MDLTYKCRISPNSDALIVRSASGDPDDDRLSFVARVDKLLDDYEIVLSKDDALDLAWSVLEHYSVTKRPVEPIKVGDFIIVVPRAAGSLDGVLGRVTEVRDTGSHISLSFTDLTGESRWVGANNVERLTPAEFKVHVNARVAEMMADIP